MGILRRKRNPLHHTLRSTRCRMLFHYCRKRALLCFDNCTVTSATREANIVLHVSKELRNQRADRAFNARHDSVIQTNTYYARPNECRLCRNFCSTAQYSESSLTRQSKELRELFIAKTPSRHSQTRRHSAVCAASVMNSNRYYVHYRTKSYHSTFDKSLRF